jgi:putative tryptophan/tyrosine transport system substrate-binding protein
MTLLGCAAAWPLDAPAQQEERMRRIAIAAGYIETDPAIQTRIIAFRKSLAALGWVEGRGIRIDYRGGANDWDHVQSQLAEVIELQPDVILTNGTPHTRAAHQQTRTIPIVFVLVTDPVGSGLVASLAHPGANITGFTNFEYAIGGKWLEILRESAPHITRVLAVQNPANAGAPGLLREIESGARSFGMNVSTTSALDVAELERAVEAFAREPDGGLLVLPDSATSRLRSLIVALAARHRLPAIYPFRFFAETGGLVSYGDDPVDQFQRAASYVNRILKGEKPGDLPVEAPTKFELVINLRAAKALGLTVPSTLLATADEVIE